MNFKSSSKTNGYPTSFWCTGDFNLSYLEQVEADPQLEFIGNCNELNAAYAADGYARINGFLPWQPLMV